MEELASLTEQLASAVVMADPGDLPALAAIHTQFESLAACAMREAEESGLPVDRFQSATADGANLVEQVILREAEDPAATLGSIGDTITLLQEMLTETERRLAGDVIPLPLEDGEDASPEAATAPPEPAPAAAPDPPTEDEPTYVAEDDVVLVTEFIAEGGEHIESAEAGLLELEEDPENAEVINAIFRAFHTIKGVAGFVNLKQIGSLAHSAENLLDLARKGNLTLSGASVDVVLESIDMMKIMLGSLEGSVADNKPIEVQLGLPALLERIHACAAGEAPDPKLGEILVERGSVSEEDVTDAVQEQMAGESDKKVGQILVSNKMTTAKEVTRGLREQRGAMAPAPRRAAEGTVKVATGRLDRLINLVGELVIAQSMVSQDVATVKTGDERLGRDMNHMGKISRELQDLSMSMRMVPVQGVFQKMARLVRDLSRKAGKEIDFVVTGAKTELDRNVVEVIGDPLVHMVRNSVDHGIATPEERQKAGKSRQGRVELKAYHQAGNIVIEIIDDGQGLNRDRILEKAIKQGVVKEGQELTDTEIYRLIFHAGLSTAEKVTDVSGRGVGMDVVRKNIESLRGRIDIASTEGEGSVFTMRLPLTLAIIDGQVVRVGDQRYIIPIISIEQSIQPTGEQISTVQNRGEMLLIRGSLLPLFRLHELFAVSGAMEDPTQGLVVIVQDNQRRCSLLVDELLGQQQVVIKALGDTIGKVQGVSGGAILGDGNVSLILDVPGLIDLANTDVELAGGRVGTG